MTRRRTTHIPPLIATHQLKTLTGRAHAILTGRAAAGITAALRVMGFQNRAVLIPANTCYIVLWAVLESGNIPYLVDIDPVCGSMTAQTLTDANVNDVAAIIPCHLYGIPAPMRELCAWAKAHGAVVIEDSALAIGVEADGQAVGSWGDVSVFSFGTEKIVDIGYGGALMTDDARLANEIEAATLKFDLLNPPMKKLGEQWAEIYWALHQFEGENPRLGAIYPTLHEIYKPLTAYRLPSAGWRELPHQLDALSDNLAHRWVTVGLYESALRPYQADFAPQLAGLALWRYPLFVDAAERDNLLNDLWAHGIDTATRWYPSLAVMRAALCPSLAHGEHTRAEQWSASVINLPVDLSIDAAMVERICAVIQAAY